MPDQTPATKADLDRAVASMVTMIEGLKNDNTELRNGQTELRAAQAELRASLAATEASLIEHFRDMQSELLRGFQSYAQGQTARVHTLEATLPDVLTRLAAVEDRVLYLETRRPQN